MTLERCLENVKENTRPRFSDRSAPNITCQVAATATTTEADIHAESEMYDRSGGGSIERSHSDLTIT
jgi:hypothetical protein